MMCKIITACKLEEEAAHSGMKPLVFSQKGTISLKRMYHDLHCHFNIIRLTCVHQSRNVFAYLSCLLLIYILASEASCW